MRASERDLVGRQAASEAGWEALWPKHRLIERDLYCFGMEVLLDLDLGKQKSPMQTK